MDTLTATRPAESRDTHPRCTQAAVAAIYTNQRWRVTPRCSVARGSYSVAASGGECHGAAPDWAIASRGT